MVEVNIAYRGDLRCEAAHGPSGNTLLTDAPADNHGKAEYFSPTDLVATALGTCILTTMAIVATGKLKIELGAATATVEKEMAAAPSRRIGALKVALKIPGEFTELQKEILMKAAHSCPVHKSMHPDVQMPITFEWTGA
jgi:putative redox protein